MACKDTVGEIVLDFVGNFFYDLLSAQPLALMVPSHLYFRNIRYHRPFSSLYDLASILFGKNTWCSCGWLNSISSSSFTFAKFLYSLFYTHFHQADMRIWSGEFLCSWLSAWLCQHVLFFSFCRPESEMLAMTISLYLLTLAVHLQFQGLHFSVLRWFGLCVNHWL